MLQSTPGVPPIVSDQLCLVYQAETGQILHSHRVTTYEGGHAPAEAYIRRRAIENMRSLQSGAETHSYKTVLMRPEQLKPGVSYKIDVEAVRLVSVDSK